MKSTLVFTPRSSAQVLRGLLVVIAVLATLSLLGQYSALVLGHERLLGFVPEFGLDYENNIPTYFTALLLLSAALLAWGANRLARVRRDPFARHWAVLGGILAYISVDEIASLHERLIPPLRHALGADGIFYFAWVIPGIVLLLLFLIAYARFFWALERRWKRLFAAAGTIYVAGGLGMELVGGGYVSQYGQATLAYALISTVEEVLEMVGLAVLIYALLEYMRAHLSSIRISLNEATEGSRLAVQDRARGEGGRPAPSSHQVLLPTKEGGKDASHG
jgi:hypothetical protein